MIEVVHLVFHHCTRHVPALVDVAEKRRRKLLRCFFLPGTPRAGRSFYGHLASFFSCLCDACGNTAGWKPVLSNVNWLLTFEICSVIRLKGLAIAVLHGVLPFMHLLEVFQNTIQTLLIYICNSWTQTCQMNTNCHWRNQDSSNYQGMGRWNCRYPHCCRVEVLCEVTGK